MQQDFERLAAEGFSAATILFAEPHDFSRLRRNGRRGCVTWPLASR
jgi:hypothetical protein